MIWFLRLFARYRLLETQIAEAASARISAEDNSRYWRNRAEVAETDKEKARGVFERNLKQVANYEAHRTGAPCVPFPDVWVVPPTAFERPEPGSQETSQRRSARDVQQAAIARSRKAAADHRAQVALANENNDADEQRA